MTLHRITQVAYLAHGLLLASSVVFAGARAHEALPTATQPMGWSYGWECCSAFDCSQVHNEEIREGRGGYTVVKTGEVIPYGDARIKRSRDEFYHRCTPGGNVDAPRSLCLYVPDRGF